MSETILYLDHQKKYPLKLSYDAQARNLRVDMQGLGTAKTRFQRNIRELLQLTDSTDLTHEVTSLDGKPTNGEPASKTSYVEKSEIIFHNVAAKQILGINGRHFASLNLNAENIDVSSYMPLTVSQKRMIGTYHINNIDRFHIGQFHDINSFETRLQHAEQCIIGDFHTHSSGQISAKGQVDVALAHDANYPYPVHLLEDIGITLSDARKAGHITVRPRVLFPPLEPQKLPKDVECFPLRLLTDAERTALIESMALPDSQVATYNEMEVPAYKMRYPFTKDPDLTKASIKKVAEEAAANGLDFMELSYVSLEKPEIFQAVHEAIREVENDPATQHVKVHLKYGIPRTVDNKKIKECLDKAKIIAQSPYVTAIDLLGYEDNKTEEFEKEISEFADWVHKNDPDLMLCIHAGENDKNEGNVLHALQFAKKHGVTVRIGHGLHGMNEKAWKLAKELAHKEPPQVYFEINPDSNIALNNLMDPSDLMIKRFIKDGIPFVPGSDSYGLYQTSRRDLAATFMDAGLDDKGFEIMRKHQEQLKARLQARSEKKAAAIHGWHTAEGFASFIHTKLADIKKVPPAPTIKSYEIPTEILRDYLSNQDIKLIDDAEALPPELADKKPITLLGASGSSWERIEPEHKREIAIAYDMLVHAMDPKKVYFAQGRNKNSGISKVINEAIARANYEAEQTGNPVFYNLGFQADISLKDNYSHLSHMLPVKSRVNVADAIVDFTVNNDGIMVAAAGAGYTRDAILKADLRTEERHKGWLMVMDGPRGASTDKARGLYDSYAFKQGKQLLAEIASQPKYRALFKPGVDVTNDTVLEQLYQDAVDRIGDQYGVPAPQHQQVRGGDTVEKSRQLH